MKILLFSLVALPSLDDPSSPSKPLASAQLQALLNSLGTNRWQKFAASSTGHFALPDYGPQGTFRAITPAQL